MKLSFRPYMDLLVRYLRPQRRRVLALSFLLLSGMVLQLINPQVIRHFIDAAQSGGSRQALLLAAVLFIAISLAQRAAALAANTAAQNVGWTATNALRRDLALHCLQLDLSFHKKRTPGELIERVDGDVTALANYFSQFVLRILSNGLLVVGILAMLFREDLRVGLGLTLYTLVAFLILGGMQRLAVPRWAAARQAAAEQYGFIEERVSGAEEIRAMAAEAFVLQRLYLHMRSYLEKVRAAYLVNSLLFNFTGLLFSLGYAIGLGLGVVLYTRGEASLGAAYLIVYYIGMLSTPLQDIQDQAQDFQQAAASIQRIQELLDQRPSVREHPPGGSRLKRGPLPVEFRQVSFSYLENGANGNVLEDVSFALQPGEVLGVLGRTGSGKSTLTRLLFRLYDPSGGSILLGGTDLRHIPLAELRARVGMVTQEVQLFQATVRDNLALFNRGIGDDRIESALKELRLWDWLRSLSQGLDTPLFAGGRGLSAGEAQLLAFTRVLLKDPGLVILDEASSRLDPMTEALLEQAVGRLLARRTGILIAHRLHTVQRADRILILEAGRVVEHGPRQELAADPQSRFYSLLQTGLEEALA